MPATVPSASPNGADFMECRDLPPGVADKWNNSRTGKGRQGAGDDLAMDLQFESEEAVLQAFSRICPVVVTELQDGSPRYGLADS